MPGGCNSALPVIITVIHTDNQGFLRPALGDCQAVTLDIDASAIVANKQNAKQIYKGNKGDMPMVGYSAEEVRIDAAGYQKSIIQYCHAMSSDFYHSGHYKSNDQTVNW